MAVVGSMNGLLSMETSGWKKGAKSAESDVDSLSGKFKSFLGDTKADFGKGSALGQSMKLLAGGGAVAGITMAINEAKKAADAIGEVTAAYRAGKIGAGEMTEKIIASIPVIGQAWQLGKSIKEAFTGAEAAAKAAAEKIAICSKQIDDMLKLTRKWNNETKTIVEEMDSQTKKLQQQAELDAIADPALKAKRQAEINAENELFDLRKKCDSAIHQDRLDALLAITAKSRDGVISGKKLWTEVSRNEYNQQMLEIKQLEKDKAAIVAAQAQAELAIEQNKQAKIKEIADKASQERYDKQLEADKKLAQASAKNQADETKKWHKTALEDLEAARKELLKDVGSGDGGYRSSGATARLTGGIALYAPTVANKMEQMTKEQLDKLSNIDKNIEKLKNDDSKDEQVANF